MSLNNKTDDSVEFIPSQFQEQQNIPLQEVQQNERNATIPMPQRSLTWPKQNNDNVTSHTSVDITDSRRNTIAEHSSSSHNRSLSYHLSQSVLKRSDSIRHAVQRISNMIPGGNQDDSGREIPVIPNNQVPLIDPHTKKPFINNSITTSRYKIYNFLPKQIMFQFSKIANVYFLFVAILQSIPEFSPTGRFTTIIPLSVFMMIAIAHEGFDDYRRHKQDQVENNKECSVLNVYKSNDSTTQRLGVWRKTKWRNLKVGDLISVKAQEWVPADLLLLHSAGEEGICYVETAALDGETNLKQRQALRETNSIVTSPEALADFRGTQV
jgi:magnesium-transporting ATPase (P-type)